MATRGKSAPEDKAVEVPEALSNKALSTGRRFTDDTLREVKSFEDAMALAAQTYGDVTSIEDMELGNGFKVMNDDEKERLVGVPFIILAYTFNEGEWGEFATAMLVTQYNDRLILNDGSTGIYAQLLDIMKTTDRLGGIAVPKGLRKSEYATCRECGKPRKPSATVCECGDTSEARAKGSTFYLEVS